MILLEKALSYVDNILNNHIPANEYIVKVVRKFKVDYDERQHNSEFEFYFDEKQCKKINDLLKLFVFPNGFLAGEEVLNNLADFQAFLLVNIFCWRFKENKKKFRYRDIVLYIARKNAKTFIVSIIFILLMLTEQDYSEFYSCSLNKDLASELRKSMKQLIECSPALEKHFKISKVFTGKMECLINKSFYIPRIAEADKNNSIRPSAFCADEYGAMTDKANFNAFRSGQKSVNNPISFITTTAYANSDSVMFEELDYAKNVIDGKIKNDRYFALLYYAESGNYWNDTGIYQANPLIIKENYEEIKETRERAKNIVTEQSEYLTKAMNVFLQSNEDNKYLDYRAWKKCEVNYIDFTGKDVVVGVDLSVTTDLTAVSIMYRDGDNIYCKSHGFLPATRNSNRRESIDYLKMRELGNCDLHEGLTINYSKVEEYIRNIEDEYNCTIKCIITDPMNAKEMMERLSEDYNVILLRQSYTKLSPATKEFRKMVYDGKVFYEKNALLDWNVKNAITTKGKADDEMLAKENKNKQRIDMLAVLIFAYSELLVPEDNTYSVLEALEECNEKWNL